MHMLAMVHGACKYFTVSHALFQDAGMPVSRHSDLWHVVMLIHNRKYAYEVLAFNVVPERCSFW